MTSERLTVRGNRHYGSYEWSELAEQICKEDPLILGGIVRNIIGAAEDLGISPIDVPRILRRYHQEHQTTNADGAAGAEGSDKHE